MQRWTEFAMFCLGLGMAWLWTRYAWQPWRLMMWRLGSISRRAEMLLAGTRTAAFQKARPAFSSQIMCGSDFGCERLSAKTTARPSSDAFSGSTCTRTCGSFRHQSQGRRAGRMMGRLHLHSHLGKRTCRRCFHAWRTVRSLILGILVWTTSLSSAALRALGLGLSVSCPSFVFSHSLSPFACLVQPCRGVA